MSMLKKESEVRWEHRHHIKKIKTWRNENPPSLWDRPEDGAFSRDQSNGQPDYGGGRRRGVMSLYNELYTALKAAGNGWGTKPNLRKKNRGAIKRKSHEEEHKPSTPTWVGRNLYDKRERSDVSQIRH